MRIQLRHTGAVQGYAIEPIDHRKSYGRGPRRKTSESPYRNRIYDNGDRLSLPDVRGGTTIRTVPHCRIDLV